MFLHSAVCKLCTGRELNVVFFFFLYFFLPYFSCYISFSIHFKLKNWLNLQPVMLETLHVKITLVSDALEPLASNIFDFIRTLSLPSRWFPSSFIRCVDDRYWVTNKCGILPSYWQNVFHSDLISIRFRTPCNGQSILWWC